MRDHRRVETQGTNDAETAHGVSVEVVGPSVLARALESLLRENGVHTVPNGGQVRVLLPAAGNVKGQDRTGCVVISDGTDLQTLRTRGLQTWSLVGINAPICALLQGIEAAARKEAYCSPCLLARLLSTICDVPVPRQPCLTLREHPSTKVSEALSRREREIADYAARGLANTQIAEELCISLATVKFHLFHVFRKLGIERRSQLAGVLGSGPQFQAA